MRYSYSSVDHSNSRWFANDNSCASLCSINLTEGCLRGLQPFKLNFNYPIAAIAGENGSGKSTLLALATCAFHNAKTGYRVQGRKNTYYTFSDFFIQNKEEIPPQGIKIKYGINHNNWKGIPPGLGYQDRTKKEGGQWNKYARRVSRNVIYYGLSRVVPHFERSTHKSYRSRFKASETHADTQNRIAEIASRIIGKTYETFEIHKYSKYSLPVTCCNGSRYSGFNMGAGESAVFDILTGIFEAGKGALLVIDEIELGLHEKAQNRLITEMKDLCNQLHCQIICSTHSPIILKSLPPEARFFIENTNNQNTEIYVGISSDWACGKLAGKSSAELDIFVEDDVAQTILKACLPHSIRNRVTIKPIGSAEVLRRQLASNYLVGRNKCLAIFDGDKKSEDQSSISKVVKYTEASTQEAKDAIRRWVVERQTYLPGNTWPERFLLELALFTTETLGDDFLKDAWGTNSIHDIIRVLKEGLRATKHNEFYTVSNLMDLDEITVRSDIIRFVKNTNPNFLNEPITKISNLLDGNT